MEHLKRMASGGTMFGRIVGFVRLMALVVALASGPGGLVARAADEAAARTSAPAAGQQVSASSWAYDLAGELMSPFCPGRTLASCPSPQAGELIQWIATQEAAGVSRDEVIAILIERHGEEILGAPPASGITLWAYVFPVLGFLAFGGIAAIVLSRVVATKGGGSATEQGVPSEAASGSASAAPARNGLRASSSEELARIVDAELAERA